jgi:hypothetical protein
MGLELDRCYNWNFFVEKWVIGEAWRPSILCRINVEKFSYGIEK